MKRVFKHYIAGLGAPPIVRVETGQDAKVVLAGKQENGYYLWVEDTPRSHGARVFKIFATGADIPDFATHRYSFQDLGFVWHVYELVEEL